MTEYLKQPSLLQARFTLQELKKDEKLLSILNEALKVLVITIYVQYYAHTCFGLECLMFVMTAQVKEFLQ